MSSYLQGLRLGGDFVEEGFNQYERNRAWADKLTERKAAKLEAEKARTLEAERYKDGKAEKGLQNEIDVAKFDRTQDEVERHNAASEAKDASSRWSFGYGGKTLKMDEKTRQAEIEKNQINFLEAMKQGRVDAIQTFGDNIEEFGGEPPPYQDNSRFWEKSTHKYETRAERAKGAAAPGKKVKYEKDDWRAASGYPGIK